MSQVNQIYTVFGRDFHFEWECPGKWNDLNSWQLRRIIALQQIGLPRLRFMALCVPILLNVRRSLVKQFVLGRTLNAEYLQLTDFLVSDEQYLTRNIIGRYRGLKTVKRWQDMVGRQYFIAEGYLDQYRQTQDAKWLDYFLCAFYAPDDQEFATVDEDVNCQLFKKWPMDVKLCILAFYAGSRREFQQVKQYKKAFKKGSGRGGSVAESLMKLRSQMAGNDLTKTKQIDATPLPELLFQLNKDIADAEQRTQQLSSRK